MILQPHRDHSSLFGTALYMLTGPLLWALHMTAVYGSHTLLCTVEVKQPMLWGASPSAVAIMAATLVAVAFLAVFIAARQRMAKAMRIPQADEPQRAFLDGLMLWLGFLSIAGIVWSGATVMVLDACAQLR